MNLLIHWGSKIILVQNTTITRKKKTKNKLTKTKNKLTEIERDANKFEIKRDMQQNPLEMVVGLVFFFVIFKSVFIMKKIFCIDFKVLISKIKI